MRRKRVFKNNRKYGTYKNNKFNRFIISQFNKLLIAIAILLILLILKTINLSLTNNVIQIIHNGINHEFNIRKSGENLKRYGTKILDIPQKIVSVFTSDDTSIKLQPPIKGAIYKPFGEVKMSDKKTDFNNGIDIIPKKGEQEVLSVSKGKILEIEDKKNLGFTVVISYENLKFVYGHLTEVYAEKGEEIEEGQKIGTLGHEKNGNKYLHFEVWREDKPIDPETIINMDTKYN